jgi:hypothetical protein
MQQKKPRRLVPPSRLPDYGYTLKSPQRKALEDAGLFPKRVPMSARTHAYIEDELIEHGEAKIAERDEQIAQERKSTNT